jgi:hypothetical protein
MSILTKFFSGAIEFGNKYFTLSGFLFRSDKKIFIKIEIMTLAITIASGLLLYFANELSYTVGLIVSIFFAQRLLEYVIVYSRNLILGKGRIFTHFESDASRGQWFIMMFALNIAQILIIFAFWYHLVSLHIVGAFSHTLNVLDSLYFSFITFSTVGYGYIVPLLPLAKWLVILQIALGFYTIVIVINGLILMHFRR